MEIRFVTEHDDLGAVSNVYEKSWKYAYKNIIPQSYLDGIPKGKWLQSLDNDTRHSLIMLDGDKVIGTSSFGASRFDDMDGYGEIISVYLLPEYIGKGCGKQLFQAAVDELKQMGYNDIFLWVLEENTRARRFYEKFGFKTNGKILNDNIGGRDLTEIQYIYSPN